MTLMFAWASAEKILPAVPRVDFETLYSRIQNDKAMQRPLFLNHTKEEFKKIFEGRLTLYEDIATHIVDVEDKTPEEIAEIIRCL